MNKLLSEVRVLLLVCVCSVVLSGCSIAGDKEVVSDTLPNATVPAPVSQVTSSPLPVDFIARFEIYTNGTKRIFSDEKYHNQSTDVYIEKLDPHVIFIKKSDVTWNDFFGTLPFSVKKDCLVTGTQQTFCTTDEKKLYFYLNGLDTPDALDQVIAPNDMLRVEYGPIPPNQN